MNISSLQYTTPTLAKGIQSWAQVISFISEKAKASSRWLRSYWQLTRVIWQDFKKRFPLLVKSFWCLMYIYNDVFIHMTRLWKKLRNSHTYLYLKSLIVMGPSLGSAQAWPGAWLFFGGLGLDILRRAQAQSRLRLDSLRRAQKIGAFIELGPNHLLTKLANELTFYLIKRSSLISGSFVLLSKK